jgi:hypothetical protein
MHGPGEIKMLYAGKKSAGFHIFPLYGNGSTRLYRGTVSGFGCTTNHHL